MRGLVQRVLSRLPSGAAIAFFSIAAAYYFLSGVFAIANLAFPQLMADQYRFYPNYITRPFPDSVLQLENGHRPIVPALVRVAEIRAFDGSLKLQIAVGMLAIIVSVLAMAWVIVRRHDWTPAVRAAGVAFVCMAVLWLANARMLLHSNEMVPVYLVIAGLVLGAGAVHRASNERPVAWMTLASLAAAMATFSFGPGIACFAAFACVAWFVRVPPRGFVPLGLVALACLVVYLGVLPGDQGVRQSLQWRPLDNFVTGARWLSSPWIHAWFGLADPALNPGLAQALSPRRPAGLLLASANAAQAALHLPWRGLGSTVTGAAGLIALIVLLVWRATHRHRLHRVDVLAYTLALFGAASAAIIGMGRLSYLAEHPEQTFADRYLVWPCLFWLGLGLLALSWTARRNVPWRGMVLSLAAAIPLVLHPTHRAWANWAAAVHDGNAATAAAALSDFIDPALFPDHRPDASRNERISTLALLKRERLGVFAAPQAMLPGQRLSSALPSDGATTVRIDEVAVLTDARDGRPGLRIRGVVVSGIAHVGETGALAIIDSAQMVTGIAAFTRFGDGRGAIRFSLPRKRGFTAYVQGYVEGERYRLVHVGVDNRSARVLADIPPGAPERK